MKALLVTGCSDPHMWYANHIGKVVPLLSRGHTTTEFLSREPAGYTNIVKRVDAEEVDVPQEDILYLLQE